MVWKISHLAVSKICLWFEKEGGPFFPQELRQNSEVEKEFRYLLSLYPKDTELFIFPGNEEILITNKDGFVIKTCL